MSPSKNANFAFDRLPRLRGFATLTCLLAVGFAAGCEDSAARHRVEAQRTITAASAEFRKATAGSVVFGDEHFDQRQRELNGVANRVSSLPNAEAGQQAAGAMLAADALSELASMHLARAEQLQRESRHDRQSIASAVEAAGRLNARAAAQAGVTVNAERTALQRERQAAEQGLNDLRQRITALEGPINDRARRNADGEAEADRLRNEANNLVRRAIELGHAAGFPSFQQAISTRRDADSIDYDIAIRELELDYELQPEHEMAQLQAEHLNLLVDSIRQTLEEFDRLEQLLSSDLGKTRERVGALRREVLQAMQALQSRVDGEIAQQFEAARGYLERAATQAQQAASRLRGEEANAARLLHAKMQETLGQSLWAEANGIAEHLRLLSQVIEAGEAIGNTAEFRSTFQTLTAKREQLTQAAQDAFAGAEQALGGVTGRAADAAELFRQNLQRATNAVGGQAIGPAPTVREGFASAGPGAASGGQGFASPQEAVEFLRNLDWSNQSHTDRFFSAVDTSDPSAAAIVALLRDVLGAIVDFDAAVRERFGEMPSMGVGAPTFTNPRLDYEGTDRASITFDSDMDEETVDLLNRNGQWFIDASDLANDFPGGDEMDEATMRRLAEAMRDAFSDLARRTRGGEFSTVEQLEQAAAGVVLQLMMQAFQ